MQNEIVREANVINEQYGKLDGRTYTEKRDDTKRDRVMHTDVKIEF